MTKNPFLNAIAASAYIVAIILLISSLEVLAGPDGEKESILIPMAMLSLLVLSVATMSYLFFFQPVQMYLDGNKKEAAALFTKTLFAFAGITAVFFLVMIIVSL